MPINFGGVTKTSGSIGDFWYNHQRERYAFTIPVSGSEPSFRGVWGLGPDFSTGRMANGAFGSLNSCAIAGGWTGSSRLTSTEEYDGTAWLSGGNLGTANREPAGCGTIISGLVMGGHS